jgi:hypothetical protein
MPIKAIPYYRDLLDYALTYNLPFFTKTQIDKVKAGYEGSNVVKAIDFGNDSGIYPSWEDINTDEGAEAYD